MTLAEQTAASSCILPHIRFATMRASSVVNYWHAYLWFRCVEAIASPCFHAVPLPWLWLARPCLVLKAARLLMCREWDPDKLVLTEALVCTAQPSAMAAQLPAKRKADALSASVAAQPRKSCQFVAPGLLFVSKASSAEILGGLLSLRCASDLLCMRRTQNIPTGEG